MNSSEKPSNGRCSRKPLKSEWMDEVREMAGENPEKYNGAYRDFAELLGDAAVMKIWKRYSGINISFPKRLYSSEYAVEYIREHMGAMRPADMARELDMTERRARQIMKEIREEQEKEKNVAEERNTAFWKK